MKKNKVVAYLIVIILGVIFFVLGCFFANIIIDKVFDEEEIHTEDYMVSAGETIWEVALENKKEGIDTREYVYELRKLNNIDNCIIYPGQVIKIIK